MEMYVNRKGLIIEHAAPLSPLPDLPVDYVTWPTTLTATISYKTILSTLQWIQKG